MQYAVQNELQGWKPDYLTLTGAYPIVEREEHIVPLLKKPFTRAVVYRNPDWAFDPSYIQALSANDLAQKYWADSDEPRGRRASRKTVHVQYLNDECIRKESSEAGIIIDPVAISLFTSRCNDIRDLFTRIYQSYTDKPFVAMHGFTLFTPKGGRGCSPELHIDNTILSVHWAAALATFRVYDGALCDETWDALSMIKRKLKSPEDQRRTFEYLVELANNPFFRMLENQIGDVMITKGQLGLDLDDPMNRAGVCVHVSSPSIIENGQAGFLMTPQMPK